VNAAPDLTVGTAELTSQDAARGQAVGHSVTADDACAQLGVDPKQRLAAARGQAARAGKPGRTSSRRQTRSPAGTFLRQYRDLTQLVLVGAASVSMVALQEFSTGLVILGLTVMNAILGPNQEGRASERVAALQKMLVIKAHVRRGGELTDVPSEELVPGDMMSRFCAR
jgi:P-type Ca2+ transporter type 2C